MKWSEFSIHTTEEAVEPVCNILHEAGASGVVIEDPIDLIKDWGVHYGEIYQLSPDDYPEDGVIVKAYFPVNSFLLETIDEVKASINGLTTYEIDLGRNSVQLAEVNEEDWATAWKKYYKPVKISKSITITPTWEDYTPTEDEMIIELDPGMAFGTGTHPTTVLCIQALESVMQGGEEVIDVGTGSGVLSIAAAKLGAKRVIGLDLDQVAVDSAALNVELNQVHDTVTVRQGNLLEQIDGSYDLVVANILAEVIVQFVQDAAAILKPGGAFITSGIIKRKKQEVKDSLVSAGFTIDEVIEMDDWVAIIARK
ncbi:MULTISPECIES: 50S ribosomal protein L11 methyltransferase [Alkalihalophilus]|jgi:ribosomal protein L11 methyltransferase|uniref:Ribosomal protein L11 methyltransferase n=2 Tax=Alkalihalophilus TaxID=2893060 RepID=D3FXL3_ALKPO|nr:MULTISPECIES: 50S ribosomal protein L11 methyltransferase [Alkalihalophilus]ADC50724.1 ribosomal protein L11 methyltransferase [Alkalihalophilus pseudofirmus OF4]ERN54705.1 ribosomal protein L11 methyltransferase [Alkalihalophilus marmarensis DSM 21297]MCM3488674.1 50S ribosomal protein L11 methyltransferase [Alkalihalophilus marmarensis]MEC2070420.1 50S ribosomal protein L11 methyltransferase [Alkalihalophilus marmarensis]OLS35694.1 ribosomal protein L11 methyltransferase [Alkalihalophilus